MAVVAVLFGVGIATGALNHSEEMLRSWAHLDEALWLIILLFGALSVLMIRSGRSAAEEHRLRETTEERFRALIEESPAVTYTWDARHHVHTYVSPQVEPLLGYTPQEWGEDWWLRCVHPDDRDLVLAASKEADRTGADFVAEYRVLTPDGRTRWVRDQSRNVQFDREGQPVIAQGVIYDVTSLKEADARASEAEAKFQTIVERVPAVAYVWDGNAASSAVPASYISPQIETLLGYTAADWLERPQEWSERVHPDDLQRVLRRWVEAVEAGSTYLEEYRIQRADGEWIWLRDEANPVGGNVAGEQLYQGVMFDITERREAEERLREAEERWRTLLEHLPVVAYMIESAPEGGVPDRWVAPGIEQLTGLTAEEWLADANSWEALLHPDDRDTVLAAWSSTAERGRSFEMEYRMVRADGSTVWVRDQAVSVRRGDRFYAEGVFVDVTERREAEQALREAEGRFRTLVEQLPAITYIEDPTSGENLYISPQIEDLLGYSPEEWVGDSSLWEERLHPDDHDWVVSSNAAETGDEWSVDYRAIARDGHVVWLHNDARLVRGDGGAPLYWQGITFDITERKVAEERLREAEERYRGLVEQLPVAVYTDAVDEVSTALYVSPKYEQLTGYTPEQRLLDPGLWVRMLHPDDRERVLAESARTNETGEPFDTEYRVVRADGQVAWLHDHAMLVEAPGGKHIWQGVLQDVTERRQAEDALSRRDAILQATGFAAEQFLRSTSWIDVIDGVLRRLGIAGDASRSCVFANQTGADGVMRTSLVHAWNAPDHQVGGVDPASVEFPWREGGFGRWADLLGNGGVVHGLVRDFPASEREVLERDPLRIRSLIAVSIFVEDEWWGYLGFDQCDEDRIWHEAEIEALAVTASTLGAAITRERGAKRLADTETRYRSLIETIPAVTYIDTLEQPWSTVYVSPQVEAVFGYSAARWCGELGLWRSCLHPDEREAVERAVARHNETQEPFDEVYRLRHDDGSWLWVRDQATTVRDADGQPLFSQGVMYDITATMAAEERLRAAEERYRGIVEHVPAVIYLDKPDRTMATVYVSPQIEQITGVTPEQWLADPELWITMMEPEDRPRAIASYLGAAERGIPWSAEYRVHTTDGRTIWVHDETTFLHDQDGIPTYLQGVIFDITERKLAEQALRESEQREREAAERLRALDDMKNTFLAAVSHELRSPLTSILGLSLTLERAPDMPVDDRDDLLKRLAANSRKLDRLLKDLLDIDRLNRGIVEPQYRVIDIGALARRTVENLDALAGRDIVTQTESVVIAVDPPKVERIVENLLMNAARHTTPDRRIWLQVTPYDGGVLIAVEDDGPGVPAELRGAIFEPFRQGPTSSPHSPGTGIGLSLVSRFAALHDGRAWVEDREGGGASFRVFLPGHVDAVTADARSHTVEHEATASSSPRADVG